MSDGTPLPSALSGVIVQRLVEIDEALLYLISGALSGMLLKEPLEQTGALTPETAQNALSVMLETYLNEDATMTPVGATMIWHMEDPPDRWLICDGTGVLKAEYPQLYDLFGGKYGESTDFFGVPNLRSRIPYGADFDIELDEEFGEAAHTLITAEMPLHDHPLTDLGHTHRVQKQSATVNAAVNVATPAARTDNPAAPHIMTDAAVTGITIGNTGGSLPHNNIPPVLGVNFIVYAGR